YARFGEAVVAERRIEVRYAGDVLQCRVAAPGEEDVGTEQLGQGMSLNCPSCITALDIIFRSRVSIWRPLAALE
ncbi:MAG: hypothetical protein IJI12_08320, partial [Atopobiaceae bacterium]|nr:hypothetical protein [Atopobiaceae bacterium]